jgi:hypothetical protein
MPHAPKSDASQKSVELLAALEDDLLGGETTKVYHSESRPLKEIWQMLHPAIAIEKQPRILHCVKDDRVEGLADPIFTADVSTPLRFAEHYDRFGGCERTTAKAEITVSPWSH